MRACGIAAVAFCAIFAGAARADAQEKGQVGVTMGYPAAIGLLWHVSDRVAIRPEFSFVRNDNSSIGLFSSDTTFWSLGTGVSALFYTPVRDNLRTYVSPRFSYSRARGDSGISRSTSTNYSFAGMFGAQYALGRRFGVFGEVGFAYGRSESSSMTELLGQTRVTSDSDSIGTRTGVGIVLYF
jgi:hypothetical protein